MLTVRFPAAFITTIFNFYTHFNSFFKAQAKDRVLTTVKSCAITFDGTMKIYKVYDKKNPLNLSFKKKLDVFTKERNTNYKTI